MKVLQINSVCGIKSSGRICTDIASFLEENGHTCKIAYGREDCPEPLSRFAHKFTNEFDVRVNALFARIFDNAGFGTKRATKKLIKWIDEYNPDIIHLHNLHGYYINVKVLFNYLKSKDVPVIWTLHDCWSFTGHCAYFDFVDCHKWVDGCFNCPQKSEYPASFLFDKSKSNYSRKKSLFSTLKNLTLLTPSRWLSESVKGSYLKDFPVQVLNNGVDTNFFKPTESNFREKYGIDDKKMLLGVASVWDRRKGLDDFVELSKRLDDSYKIVLVGLNKEQMSSIPSNIIAIPRVLEASEIAEIYSAADIYLNLSVEETMGLTTVESLACGTPVIVYDRTAVPEFVEGTCGAVVRAGDIDALLEQIKSLNIDSNSCVKAASNFEKRNRYSLLLKLYEKLI